MGEKERDHILLHYEFRPSRNEPPLPPPQRGLNHMRTRHPTRGGGREGGGGGGGRGL